MNDLISRQAAIEVLIAEGRNVDSRYLESERIIHESDAVEAISLLPSAQPEIIRCKDCENWDTTWQNDWAKNYHYCPLIDGTRNGDWYCADAERKRNEVWRMTKEEAVASIKTLCNTCELFPKCVNEKPECFKAIELAISALQAQGVPDTNVGDTISRQAAIDAFEESYLYYDEYDDARVHNALDAVFEKIKELPSAQPEIVRCKDCKKYDTHDHRCKHWNHGVVVMDWCSRAERRTDGQTVSE